MTLYYKTTVYPVVEIILSKIVLVLEPRFVYLKTYGKNNFSKAMCRWVCNRIFWINPKNSRETTLLSWKHQGWMIHKYSSVKTASFQNIKPDNTDNTAKKYFLYTMYTFLSHSPTGWKWITITSIYCTMMYDVFIILINKKKRDPTLFVRYLLLATAGRRKTLSSISLTVSSGGIHNGTNFDFTRSNLKTCERRKQYV